MRGYRTTENFPEIFNLLADIEYDESEVIVWQNNGSSRMIVVASVSELNQRKRCFGLKARNGSGFKFDKRLPIYFKSKNDIFVFKEQIVGASRSVLILPIPNKIHAIEKRMTPRKVFEPESDNRVELDVFKGFSDKAASFSLRMLDVSTHGMGMYLSAQQLTTFQEGMTLKITQLMGQKFDPPIEATLLYIKPFKVKKGNALVKSHRAGVKFSRPIDLEFKT